MQSKFAALGDLIRAYGSVVVAYSGGADSALVAEVAHRQLGASSLAVTADSPSIPRSELADATKLARERGWHHRIVSTLEMQDERYAANPSNRCYFCRSELFEVLIKIAGPTVVLTGTNADDLSDHRPGLVAASERGIRQPLADAGLLKRDVRALSRKLGLPTADKPAAACLASRIAYGVEVTVERLARIEASEQILKNRGFKVVRVRDLGADRARVEVGTEELEILDGCRQEVTNALNAAGFSSVELDPKGYRQGALNEGLLTLGSRPQVNMP